VPSEIVLTIPSQIDEWQFQQSRADNYRPSINSPDAVNEGCYGDAEGKAVCAYIGYFWNEEQGKELISDLNSVYDGKEWKAVKTTQHDTVGVNPSLEVRETLVRSAAGKEKIVWHWYYLTGNHTSSPGWAKLLGIWAELTGQRGAAVFVISTDIQDNLNESRARLQRFLSQTLSVLEHSIKNVSIKYEISKPA
jgi:EpsI family protein